MINFTSFTRAFTLFCLVVFVYILVPESTDTLNQVLKFSVLIGIIGILIFYNQLLKQSGSNSLVSDEKPKQSDEDFFAQSSDIANDLYDNLKSLIL